MNRLEGPVINRQKYMHANLKKNIHVWSIKPHPVAMSRENIYLVVILQNKKSGKYRRPIHIKKCSNHIIFMLGLMLQQRTSQKMWLPNPCKQGGTDFEREKITDSLEGMKNN